MTDRSGNRILINGTSGTGKTNLGRVLCQDTKRLLAFDPDEQFIKMPGVIQINNPESLLEILTDCWDLPFRVSYEPQGDLEAELDMVSQMVLGMQQPYRQGHEDAQKVTLAVDELHQSYPLQVSKNHAFSIVAQKGRKCGINVIGITPLPADVGMKFRQNVNRCAAFYITGEAGRKAVAKIMDDDDSVVQGIVDVAEFSYLYWEMGQKTKWEYMPPVPLFADPAKL